VQLAAREADGPDEAALRRSLGHRADVAVPQLVDQRIDDEQPRSHEAVDEDVDVRRRRHLPGPAVEQDAAVRQARQDRVPEVGQRRGREHRQVGAEPEVDAEVLRVRRARQRRRHGRRAAEVHGRAAAEAHPRQ
jgi:hypothetical protein